MQVLTYQQKEPTGETSLSTKCRKLGQSARHRPPQRSDSHCILLLAEPPNAATNTSVRRFLEAAPDRAIWGTDWPHTHYQGTMPNDADLLELLYRFAHYPDTQMNILVRNPERLFGRLRQCRRFEVPTPSAANSVRNFKSKSGTRIIELLVPLCFRSSCQSVLKCITSFGNGALVIECSTSTATR